MLADPLGFFSSANTPRKKSGGLGVNKRNRGYPVDFEFIERPLLNYPELRFKVFVLEGPEPVSYVKILWVQVRISPPRRFGTYELI